MSLTRSSAWIALAAGFALALGPGGAVALQDKKDDVPKKPSGVFSDVSNYKSAPSIPPADLPKAKATFAAFAKYHADLISHPKVHTAPQEFRPDNPSAPPPPPTVDQIIIELNRHILLPIPGTSTSLPTPENADYVRELGAALDAALKPLTQGGDQIVRVNATRLLAAACRSGAHAHWPTVTELVGNANTPPEVKVWAFSAAGNLLAAYDLNDYQSRQHAHKPKEVGELIAALEKAVLQPDAILAVAAGPDGKPAEITPDQQAVVAFIRREAVRALAKARFAQYPPQSPTLYPAFTLARVAVSDPAIVPPPSPAEVAEAVIGICNMTPPRQAGAAEPYAYAMADAVATGIITFAGPRAANPSDRSVAWRGYAARLTDGLRVWRALFDPAFNPTRPNAFAAELVPKPITDLATQADRLVLGPIERAEAGGKVDLEGLRAWRDALRGDKKKWTPAPFRANPDLKIPIKS